MAVIVDVAHVHRPDVNLIVAAAGALHIRDRGEWHNEVLNVAASVFYLDG